VDNLTNAELREKYAGPEPSPAPKRFAPDKYRRVGREVCDTRRPRINYQWLLAESGVAGETLMQIIGEERTERIHAELDRESMERTVVKGMRKLERQNSDLLQGAHNHRLAMIDARDMYNHDTGEQGAIMNKQLREIEALKRQVEEQGA